MIVTVKYFYTYLGTTELKLIFTNLHSNNNKNIIKYVLLL